MRRTLIGSTVLLAAALTLSGCAASMGGASGAYDQGVSAPESAGDGGAVAGDSGGYAEEPASDADRQVVITGNVTITAEDPLKASREAVRIVEAAGGRVDGRTEYAASDGDRGSAQLELRIPADKLTAVLDKLEELGSADEVALHTSDVTVQVQDLDARISALRASIERISALIAQAKDIDDLITLENEISNRQAELESLEAQQRYLADQVSMSTISLYLRSDAAAPPKDPDTFLTGLGAGWDGFVAFWSGLLVVLGVLLPWILTFGIIAVAIVWIVRARRRRAAAGQSPS
ncbi:MAG: DUF4349 domain-containing protein [Microbacteriaceae bacterium]|nr:DUF4349 domain-containing protein [Microbacteriaceae bacterium]